MHNNMKNILYRIALISSCILFAGCLGDNYSQPNASLYGKVIDPETGEFILQDIGSEGSQIEFIEQGYETTSSRYLNFKTDGTYCEKNMFKGQYLIKTKRVNFVPIEDQIVDVKGETEFNISAKPYCRINVNSIEFIEDKQRVEAKFTVTCTTKDVLKEIGLFCDPNKNVSYSINNYGDKSCKVEVNKMLTAPESFSIKMPVTALEDDTDYYFRLGAHTAASEARWNYAEAVKIHIVRKEIPQKERGIRWDLFDHIEYWYQHKTVDALYWDTKDFKTGGGSVVSVSKAHEDGEPGYTQFFTPGEDSGGISPKFDASSLPFEGTHMLLTLYVSDANHLEKSANGQIEIGSAGIFDQEEICWTFGEFELRDGWQTLDLSLPEGNAMGSLRPKAINWFRLYHLKEQSPTTIKCDEIRFYYKTLVDDCESESDWQSPMSVILDETNYKQGEASVSTTNKQDMVSIEKVYKKPYYAPGRKNDGYLQFWIYVSDADKFNASTGGQIEITSSGKCDVNELGWAIPTLYSGWNKVVLKLSDGVARGGDIDLKKVNFFRIWNKIPDVGPGEVTIKIDGIRFFREGYAPEDEEAD